MATKIFVDQENGEIATAISSKDRLKLSTGSAKLQLKGHPGKVFGSSGPGDRTSRKALGNVNKQVVAPKSVPIKKGELKVKATPTTKFSAGSRLETGSTSYHCQTRKPKFTWLSEVSEGIKPNKESYPEIEICIPYDPLDFESFNVPEEHKLSHLCLAGVPLIVNEKAAERFEALVNCEPAPMDIPEFSWASDFSDSLPAFLAALEEITVDLPPC